MTITRSDSIADVADKSAAAATQFSEATKRVAKNALSSASGAVDAAYEQAQKLGNEAQRVSEDTFSYIKKEPLKAALLVTAAAAVLIAVSRAIRYSRRG